MTHNTHPLPAKQWALLNADLVLVQRWLQGFSPMPNGCERTAWLGKDGQYMVVQGLPLPDRFEPDHIDVMLDLSQFPSIAPIGLYALNANNEMLMSQLSGIFRAFRDTAFHEAESLPGYTWMCYHYANNQWKHNAIAPHKGDNLAKFLNNFYTELEMN